jgi:hypothetical protein
MSQPAHAVSDLLLIEGGVPGIHDRSVQGMCDQVARALLPRLRRFGLREDDPAWGSCRATRPRRQNSRVPQRAAGQRHADAGQSIQYAFASSSAKSSTKSTCTTGGNRGAGDGAGVRRITVPASVLAGSLAPGMASTSALPCRRRGRPSRGRSSGRHGVDRRTRGRIRQGGMESPGARRLSGGGATASTGWPATGRNSGPAEAPESDSNAR